MNFYDRLEKLRKDFDISQGELEKRLGIANGSVCKWKNRTPKIDTLEKLSSFFGVSVDYLRNGDECSQERLYTDEKAHMLAKIATNVELSDAMLKYFELSDKKKKHVLELIDLLSET